ncbi:MAG: thiamine-phosphate kinase [bacterium]
MSSQLLDIGEIGLIKHLTANESYTPEILVGVGDDAAVIKPSADKLLLMTTDMLVENVHFTLSTITPYQLGWKSMAVNMSDIAAMGGVARWAVIGIGMPANTPLSFAESLYAGIQDICQKYNTQLVGGDTVSCDRVVINITLTGEVEPENVVKRTGAQVGDLIVVTNTIGDSAAGLAAINKRADTEREGDSRQSAVGSQQEREGTRLAATKHGLDTHAAQIVIKKHLEPIPRLAESRQIVQLLSPTAMIDISDGLSIDLCRLAEASLVGARIYEDRIPISDEVSGVAGELGRNRLEFALSGGEDYELLFTISPQKVMAIDSTGVPLSVIGEITPFETGRVMVTTERVEKTLIPRGYEHFSVV